MPLPARHGDPSIDLKREEATTAGRLSFLLFQMMGARRSFARHHQRAARPVKG
jgi:hypothetical protein